MLKITQAVVIAAVALASTPSMGAAPASPRQGNACPVLESSFEAFINAMPGTQAPSLIVTGSVTLPTAGYEVTLRPAGRQSSTATFNLHLKSPQQAAQVLTTYTMRAQTRAGANVQTVVIRCAGKEIARITNIQKAF